MNPSIDYSTQSDMELITLYRKGDLEACTALLARYANLINRRIFGVGITGTDKDDLRQEAYMGLYNAVRTYDPSKNPSFSGYASACIGNSVKNLIAAASTQKAKLYRQTVPIDEIENVSFHAGDTVNPENVYLDKEAYGDLEGLIDKNLSNFEKEVLFSYLSGRDYKDIAVKLDSSQKSVDNALQRARRKLKAVLNDL